MADKLDKFREENPAYLDKDMWSDNILASKLYNKYYKEDYPDYNNYLENIGFTEEEIKAQPSALMKGLSDVPEAVKSTYYGLAPWLDEAEAGQAQAELQRTRWAHTSRPGSWGSWMQQLGETAPSLGVTAASMAPVAVAAVAGAPITIPTVVLGASIGALGGFSLGFGQTRAQALAEGQYDPEKVFDEALIRGLVSGFTEAGSEAIPIPILRSILKTPVGKTLKNKVFNVALKSAAGFLNEGSTELAGNAVEQAINNVLYDDRFEIQQLIDSFMVGGLMGKTITAPIATAQAVAQGAREYTDVIGDTPGLDLSTPLGRVTDRARPEIDEDEGEGEVIIDDRDEFDPVAAERARVERGELPPVDPRVAKDESAAVDAARTAALAEGMPPDMSLHEWENAKVKFRSDWESTREREGVDTDAARGEQVGVDVGVDEQVERTQPLATEGAAVYTPREGETKLVK